jgi:hypothetical protein
VNEKQTLSHQLHPIKPKGFHVHILHVKPRHIAILGLVGCRNVHLRKNVLTKKWNPQLVSMKGQKLKLDYTPFLKSHFGKGLQ